MPLIALGRTSRRSTRRIAATGSAILGACRARALADLDACPSLGAVLVPPRPSRPDGAPSSASSARSVNEVFNPEP